ncbi:enolase-phosphatase E1 [Coemansia sp. RSA 1722]|nr:enolase-phosphatase E1 [Coemansia sp. RSA 486]KAJ2226085.1 enolase-phosphatase E1 [Coemansia sp. RSA 485]KAJ2591191.1 enolase-phosphatase E1 [Coemansia sp. RSA 1722]
MPDYDIVLLDVEGTTTPLSFVHDVLFPYITDNLERFLADNWEDTTVQQHVRAIADQANIDVSSGISKAIAIDLAVDSPSQVQRKVLANVSWQMSENRKIAALKGLQGYMWRFGYTSGQLQGVMYDDAVGAIKKWAKEDNKRVYIYSSGSVEAQKLIFGFSDHGDLLPYLSGHYDTNTGSKLESDSYTRIARDIGVEPERILFVSDNHNEIGAADKAGMQTVISIRPGNLLVPKEVLEKHRTTSNFLDLF